MKNKIIVPLGAVVLAGSAVGTVLFWKRRNRRNYGSKGSR